MNNIQIAYLKLKKAETKLNSFLRYVIGKKLKLKKQVLKSEIDNLIHKKLDSENPIFKELNEENKRLIANENIIFKVTKNGSSPLYSITTKFEGIVHENGFLYLNATENPPIIGGLSFPGSYIGSMNFTGKVNININNNKSQIIGGRITSSYIGKIDINGCIEFESKENNWSWNNGHYYVSKIVADPFNGNNLKRKKYLVNRSKLLALTSEWKKNNLA